MYEGVAKFKEERVEKNIIKLKAAEEQKATAKQKAATERRAVAEKKAAVAKLAMVMTQEEEAGHFSKQIGLTISEREVLKQKILKN